MGNYRWTCLACNSSNMPGPDVCSTCGCPNNLSANDLARWKSGEYQKPIAPSILSNAAGPGARIAPCPHCNRLMFFKDSVCPHCSQEISADQRSSMRESFEAQRDGSYLVGGFAVLLLALVLYFGFDLYIQSEETECERFCKALDANGEYNPPKTGFGRGPGTPASCDCLSIDHNE